MKKKVPSVLAVMITIAFAVSANAAVWETEFDKASVNAQKSGLYMLLEFSGSDWCGWCKKINEEFFSSDVFGKFAKDNLICVSVDFPRQKKLSKELEEQNTGLAKQYEIRGYPTIIVLSPEGELVGKTGYSKIEAKTFVENLKKMIDEHRRNKSQKKTEEPLMSDKTDEGSGK